MQRIHCIALIFQEVAIGLFVEEMKTKEHLSNNATILEMNVKIVFKYGKI